jgi:hypothetical protein
MAGTGEGSQPDLLDAEVVTRNGRIASLEVAACACMGIRLEAATVAEAARTWRRSGDDGFVDMISLHI